MSGVDFQAMVSAEALDAARKADPMIDPVLSARIMPRRGGHVIRECPVAGVGCYYIECHLECRSAQPPRGQTGADGGDKR